MPIPSPSVKPLREPGGTHTYIYQGIVEQSGVAQDLNLDLTAIPLIIRQDTHFQSMLLVTFKSLDNALTFAGPPLLTATEFHDDGDETNAYLTIQVSSDLDTRECMILVEPRHSIGR
jgi:hypothetical protein